MSRIRVMRGGGVILYHVKAGPNADSDMWPSAKSCLDELKSQIDAELVELVRTPTYSQMRIDRIAGRMRAMTKAYNIVHNSTKKQHTEPCD